MGFRKGSYCKVWEVSPVSETMTKLRISITKKNKQTGEYEKEFSGFVACVGSAAAKKAASLKSGDRIALGDCDVTNSYNKEKGVEYTNFKVFDFTVEGESTATATQKKSIDDGEVESNEPDSDLPF